MAEHHVRGPECFRAKKDCRHRKWPPYFQDALDSPGGGTHGGVAAVVQPRLCVRKLLVQARGAKEVGAGECWLFLELRVKACTVAVGVIYLVPSIGVSG
eukprot:5505390-Pyramimonas_sp.AAC.1